ncbi:hypothetical protein MR772_10400 [bacterium]|nr:hypothetical protein [bacterium]MCI6248716.1 hypothetical protein [bacterium]MCI6885090.1 hypothetical protein [bacterium]MCI7323861.1 hypothetical protein [bacterium]
MPEPSSRPVFRCEYRGRLDHGSAAQRAAAVDRCAANAQSLMDSGALMTAALYFYGDQLFLYYEALGEPVEPQAFLAPLDPLLARWPQKEQTCTWAQMYPIYWHSVPRDEADWQRPKPPVRRCGRIALLRHETMFEYCYHHFAIVQEGLLQGDKYQFISLHEDLLFSYFEEPRTYTNIRRDPERPSRAIDAWTAVDPEAHFIPLPGSNGANFLMLPACFALGR